MITTKDFNNFTKTYKKKICYRTYRRYRDEGYKDKEIASTDLRNGGHFKYKDTIKNKCRTFNKASGLSVSYSFYYNRSKKGVTENEMIIECERGLMRGPKTGIVRGKYKKKEIKEVVRESKFKALPRIDLNIEAGEDDYYKRLAIS